MTDLKKTIVSMATHKYDAQNHTHSIDRVFGVRAEKLIQIIFEDFKSGDSVYDLIKKLQDQNEIFRKAFGKES